MEYELNGSTDIELNKSRDKNKDKDKDINKGTNRGTNKDTNINISMLYAGGVDIKVQREERVDIKVDR